MESKDKNLTSDQLQKQAFEVYLKNEGSKMIINPERLSEARRVAEEERKKATETATKK